MNPEPTLQPYCLVVAPYLCGLTANNREKAQESRVKTTSREQCPKNFRWSHFYMEVPSMQNQKY